MTTTLKQCNAAIDLNAYQHKRSCHDLIILLLPARLYASQGGSCVKPIAPNSGRLYLACWLHIQLEQRLALDVWKKCDVICKYVTCNIYISVTPVRLSPPSRGPLRFVFELTTLRSLTTLQWRPRDPICRCFGTIRSRYTRQTTD